MGSGWLRHPETHCEQILDFFFNPDKLQESSRYSDYNPAPLTQLP